MRAKEVGTLARRHPLEATAILLLGVGGLFLPFPFWLVGAAVTAVSRLFGPRDKWLALLGPAVFTLLSTVLIALIVGGPGNVVVVYSRALRLAAPYLTRMGCVLTAWYLVRAVRRGPWARVPPWRR